MVRKIELLSTLVLTEKDTRLKNDYLNNFQSFILNKKRIFFQFLQFY